MEYDIRKILLPGDTIELKIYTAQMLKEESEEAGLDRRIWMITATDEAGAKYSAACVVQTELWKPTEGEKALFERQAQGVNDDYLFLYELRLS